MKKFAQIVTLTLLLMPVFISCEDEEKDKPPAIPPYESMFIDFTQFKVQTTAPAKLPEADIQTRTNFNFSVLHVGVWSSILPLTLAVPVASFYASFSQEPKYLGNAKWEWTYSVPGFANTYTARMTGEVTPSNIRWEMYIAKSGANGHAEFKWFEGTSALDGKGGQWFLYHSYQFPEKVLQIDWEKTDNQVGSIKYTYIRELNDNRATDAFNGSYITHGLQIGNYNAFYNIHFWEGQTQQFTDVSIEWSTSQYFGHVRASYFFHDSNWHCWNNVGDDVSCQ
jgi:hypothetical protein